MKYTNQHYVTEAYLRAWCDPTTPNDGAYLWVVSKANRTIWMKSPRSLFSEQDFYTVTMGDGQRNLSLEHKLKEIEDKFITLRDKKLARHAILTESDRYDLAVFVSTAYARTKRQKEEGKQIWEDYLNMVENLPPTLRSQVKSTKDHQDVVRLHKDQPMLFHLYQFVNSTAPWIFLLNCAIFETRSTPGFLTSDNPCLWLDPAVFDPRIPRTYYGIGSRTLNVLFPISPHQYVSFQKNGPDGYVDLSTDPGNENEGVTLFNRLIVDFAEDRLVVNRNTILDEWFEDERAANGGAA